MQMNESPSPETGQTLPLLMAADLQDHLMTATNDLERLQGLLADACDGLMLRFSSAVQQMEGLMQAATDHRIQASELTPVLQNLGAAVTALQFQDMASQLINHTNRRLRNCADQIAREAMGDDEDGQVVVETLPLRPNPVTQAEMDAGSIELF
ncbi:hypothetical protein [Caldimonas caldifontis]|uniref:Chemotaxis protein n=1 Tax=Caldimonas caldifontis TaxID=1452508 RepID=A0A2S5SYP6_9BURK|nr:hypothetical protein [Caldimonas caldifontis]PPE67885.1 hypothetical protein C1704_03230 [Caldimonas caldifontis]